MKDAKGHGSNTRGGSAHQTGVNRIGQPVSPGVLDVIRNSPKGASVTLAGEQPSRGYMVALPGHSQDVSNRDLRGPRAQSIIDNYVRMHAAALGSPGAHIGVWPNKGRVTLDVSQNIPRRTAAIKAGRERNQIAIRDIRRKRDIKTGGTGT